MKDIPKRLGDVELEIMLVIWDSSGPVTSNYILEQLVDKRNWALSTLMTILARLSQKGYVYCDRSTRRNHYSALVSAQDYKEKESKSFLERVHGNSLQSLVVALYRGDTISTNDLNELQKLIVNIKINDEL